MKAAARGRERESPPMQQNGPCDRAVAGVSALESYAHTPGMRKPATILLPLTSLSLPNDICETPVCAWELRETRISVGTRIRQQ